MQELYALIYQLETLASDFAAGQGQDTVSQMKQKLLQVIQDLRKVLKLTRYQSLSLDGRLQKSMEEHRELLAAIKSKDPQLAEQVMKQHLIAGSEAMAKATSR